MPLRSTCYLFYGMEAEKGPEARKRKKSYHKVDDSSLLPVSHHSTCYLFYGIEAEMMRMMFPDFFHLHTVLPVIYFTG